MYLSTYIYEIIMRLLPVYLLHFFTIGNSTGQNMSEASSIA